MGAGFGSAACCSMPVVNRKDWQENAHGIY